MLNISPEREELDSVRRAYVVGATPARGLVPLLCTVTGISLSFFGLVFRYELTRIKNSIDY